MKSFFEQRMDQLQVTDENNKIDLIDPMADTGMKLRANHPIFKEDKQGNIEITFYNLDKELIMYEKKGNGKMSENNAKWLTWSQKRLKDPRGDMKYQMPSGGGIYPFLSPLLIEKYKRREDIPILYITEGAFKGWLAGLYGVPCIGLTSITHYNDSKTKKIHADIIKLIKVCKVQHVVILWDADCLDISTKDLYSYNDIARRPRGFFYAARNACNGIKNILNPEGIKIKYHFSHIKNDALPTQPKGLDDLLIEAKKENKTDAVVKDLLDEDFKKSRFFRSFDITNSTTILMEYFALDKNDANPIYTRFRDKIEALEFSYYGDIYKWNETASELKLVAPAYAKGIIWICDDFYKRVETPSAYGGVEEKLIKRSKASLVDELGNRTFFKYLEHYEGFCNVPNHLDYQPIHHNHYNRYSPFTHEPTEGEYQTVLDFFKHIFGTRKIEHNGKTFTEWELGLDYFQLLYTAPTQILPVLILYSEQGQTGKSTFGKWLRYVFGHNTIQVGNGDFKSEFNEHYADKLLAICEETLLDRKKDVEFIKAMATSKNVTVNPKGSKRYEIDFFCKFQFYSNNPKMIYLTKHETRFWILEVPLPTKDNPNILDDLCSQTPAFLQFILKREMVTERESRMWFNPDLLKNEMFFRTVDVNQPGYIRDLKRKLKNDFLDFGQKEIWMPLNHINKHFFRDRLEMSYLRQLLKDYLNVENLKNEDGKSKQVKSHYHKWYYGVDADGNEVSRQIQVKYNGRPYVFKREDFVAPEDEVVLDESVTEDEDLF